MFVELILLISILIFTKWFWNRRIFLSHLKRFPVPPLLPFFGHLLDFTEPNRTLPVLSHYIKTCGNNLMVYIGPLPYLIISDPILNEFVLSSNKLLDKSADYKFGLSWIGDGLLTSTGYKWRSHRKILTPSFHYNILEEFVQVFDSVSRVLVKKLNKEEGQDSFDCYEYITLCTLDIICETAMGTKINAQDSPNSEFVKSNKIMCDIMYQRVFSLILRNDFLYQFSRTYQKERKALKVMKTYSKNVIMKRRAVLLKNKESNVMDLDEFGIKRKNTFLDVLLQSTIDGKFLTDDEIQEEVDTFLFEGHDTTSISIAFTLFALSKHLDIQQKVVDELESIFGNDKEKQCSLEDLQNMKYLELVIKESLRLYPSVPVFARTIKEDIEYDGGVLPKDLNLLVAPYITHRNPDIYPDPEKFDPDRFTPENTLNRHPFAYLPFSAGPRNCIGQKFAMLELKSTISKVLRYYKVMPAIPDHQIQVIAKVTIHSSTGIKIRLLER